MLLGLFLLILGSGAFLVDWPTALAHATSDWGAASKAVPIIFLSLVYHDLVPVICAYLGGDRTRIRCDAVWGSCFNPFLLLVYHDPVSVNRACLGGDRARIRCRGPTESWGLCCPRGPCG